MHHDVTEYLKLLPLVVLIVGAAPLAIRLQDMENELLAAYAYVGFLCTAALAGWGLASFAFTT